MSTVKNQKDGLFVVVGKKEISAHNKKRIDKLERYLKKIGMSPIKRSSLRKRDAVLPDCLIMVAVNPLTILTKEMSQIETRESRRNPRKISIN